MRTACLVTILLLLFKVSYAQSDRARYKLLWKISGNGLTKPSYLFGTMHLKDRRVFDFSDSVLAKLDECPAFAMELHPDTMMHAIFSQYTYRRDSVHLLRNELSREEYRKLDKRLRQEAGVSLDELRNKSPWLIKLLLKRSLKSREDRPAFLDAYLYYLARTRQKTIIGIERLREQVPDFDSLSLEAQLDEIRSNLQSKEENKALDDLITLYHSGDIDRLHALFQPYYINNEKEDLDMRRRNLTMVTRIDSFIRQEATFIAVGAAHLPGEQGLVELLQHKGYTVTPVRATFTGLATRYRPQPEQDPWITFSPEKSSYSVALPSQPCLLPVGDMREIDSYIFSDLGTGIIYYILSEAVPTESDAAEQEKLFVRVIENITRQRGAKLNSQRKISFQGYPGRELDLVYPKENSYYRCRIYLRGNSLYLLMAGTEDHAYLQLPDVSRFFNSFRLSDYKPSVWKNIVSKAGAFKVQMPGTTKKDVSQTDDPTAGKTRMHTLVSTDEITGKAYFVIHLDLPVRSLFRSDSAFLYNAAHNAAAEVKGELQMTRPVQLQNHPGLHYRVISPSQGLAYHARVFLRGNRTYIAGMVTAARDTSAAENNPFFDSFTFTEYAKTTWTAFSPSDQSFELLMPGPVKASTNDTISQAKQFHTVRYLAQQTATGFPYELSVSSFSPYYSAPDPASFFEEKLKNVLVESDTILLNQKIDTDGLLGREIIIGSTATHTVQHLKWLLKGGRLFELRTRVPKSLANSPEVKRFLGSLRISGQRDNTALFRNKTATLLSHLTATDTTLRKEAFEALHWYRFRSEDQEILARTLLQNQPDDTASYQSVRRRLFTKLDQLGDSTAVSLIASMYPRLPEIPGLQIAALQTLINLQTRQALAAFTDLVLSKTPQDQNSIDFFYYSLEDSLPNVKVMFPRILQLLDFPAYRQDVYWLTQKALNSGVVTLQEISPARTRVMTDAQRLLQQRNLSSPLLETYDRGAFELMTMAGLLEKFIHEPASLDLLKAMLDDVSPEVNLKAVTILLRKGLPFDLRKLDRIAAAPITRLQLYEVLKEAGKEPIFPKKYATQSYFAESELLRELSYEADTPEKIELVKRREVIYQGKKGMVYLFKFKSPGDHNWYTGLSGLFPLNRKEVRSDGSLTYSRYEALSSKNPEAHIQSYLEPDSTRGLSQPEEK